MSSEAFIVDAVRTPLGRIGGALAGVRPDDLLAGAVRAIVDRSPSLDPASIDEVYAGDANGAGEDNRNVGRMALLLAGLPTTIPGCNRQPVVRQRHRGDLRRIAHRRGRRRRHHRWRAESRA